MDKLVLQGNIEVFCVRKRVKNVNFRVDPASGKVFVSYPYGMKEKDVADAVDQKKKWIENAIKTVNEKRKRKDPDSLFLLGKKYGAKYVVSHDKTGTAAEGDTLIFYIKDGNDREKAVKELYKKALKGVLPFLSRECERISGIKADSWSVRDMRTRWGSCTHTTKKIRLSLYLAKFDADCISSVMFHELCHVVHPDHGKEFYKLLLSFCPQYHECRKKMRSEE